MTSSIPSPSTTSTSSSNKKYTILILDASPYISYPLHEDFWIAEIISTLFPSSASLCIDVFYPALQHIPKDLEIYNAMIIGGSPESVLDKSPESLHSKLSPLILSFLKLKPFSSKNRSRPLFGICYGAQLLAKTIFGESSVDTIKHATGNKIPSEHGIRILKLTSSKEHPILANVPDSFASLEMHSDVFTVPKDRQLISSKAWEHQAFFITEQDIPGVSHDLDSNTNVPLPVFGFQFHLEMPMLPVTTVLPGLPKTKISGPPEPKNLFDPLAPRHPRLSSNATGFIQYEIHKTLGLNVIHDIAIDTPQEIESASQAWDKVRMTIFKNFIDNYIL